MKKNIQIFSILFFLLITFSCKAIFTTSIFSFVEKDISQMSYAEKLNYARDLLVFGTQEELTEAYTEIYAQLPSNWSEADSDLLTLAIELAFATSGIKDSISDLMSSLLDESVSNNDLMNDFIESVDDTNLEDGLAMFEVLTEMDNVEITSSQYSNAATIQMILLVKEAGGIENLYNIDSDNLDLVQAKEWAELGDFDLSSVIGGLELP
ncbi:MAG: hypothetical protein PQJ46_13675 [Spirochaetales bacterium]|nr:hypothetical protein [Spirochaetales bacterium]